MFVTWKTNNYILISLLILAKQCICISEEPKDVFIMGLLPMGGTGWPAGGALLLAANMALEHINNRTDVLNGYNLKLIVGDSQVS